MLRLAGKAVQRVEEVKPPAQRAIQIQSLGTFKDVAGLRVTELNNLCSYHGIEKSLPKNAKVIHLCHKLGISTVGSQKPKAAATVRPSNPGLSEAQLNEYGKFTPAFLNSIEQLAKELKNVPDITDDSVKKYLLNTSQLTKGSARTYKLCRPYQLKEFVHSMRISCDSSETLCFIKAEVNPSQSAQRDDVKQVYCILDKITGEPYGGYCTCTVGYCQSCGHLGAVLFSLSDMISSGLKEMPDELACTETLCKGASVAPATLDEICVSKKSVPVKMRRIASEYGSVVLGPNHTERPHYNDILDFRSRLFDATQHLNCSVSAVHALQPHRFRGYSITMPKPIESLPDWVDEDDSRIVPSNDVEVESVPLPVAFLPHKIFTSENEDGYQDERVRFIGSITYSRSEISLIKHRTMKQSLDIEWFKQMMGSLTASKFQRIMNFMETGIASLSTLLTDILGYAIRDLQTPPKPKIPSLKWGITNESNARSAYLQYMKTELGHKVCHVELGGLCIYEDKPFLRCSPDGIFSCECHPGMSRLVEIKCPWKREVRDSSPNAALGRDMITYFTKDKPYQLKCTSEGYHAQVQGGMAITGLQVCDFVIWTPHGIHVHPIKFDSDYWSSTMLPSLSKFFETYVVAEMLTESVYKCKIGKVVEPVDVSDTRVIDVEHSAPATTCGKCHRLLPEEDCVSTDNSNASVGCECECVCNIWYCWPCALYDEDQAQEELTWFCPNCVRNCDIVY